MGPESALPFRVGSVRVCDVSAVALATKLIELALLGRRTVSSADRVAGCCVAEYPLMNSTLLLLFSVRYFPDADLSSWAEADIEGMAIECVRAEASLDPLPRRVSSSDMGSAGRTGLGILRSWTHQSPLKQRSTRRRVVELTSRIPEFPVSDSSANTIWGRLYGISRSCVFVRRG